MGTSNDKITPIIKEQILQVRDTGETNMFDCNAVICIANREGCFELVDYLSDRKNREAYGRFIMTGSTEEA